VTLAASVDRARPSLQFQLASDGRSRAKLSGSLSFDASRRALAYALDADIGGLAQLAPFTAKLRGLGSFDLSQLALGLSAHGVLFGVVAAVARDGTIELAPDPARSAMVEGTTALRVSHFRWAKGDTAVSAPTLAWHGDMHVAGELRTLASHVEAGSLHLALGGKDIDVNGIDDQAAITVRGNLLDPEIEISQQLAVRAVEQALVPEYPLGDLVVALAAERSSEGVVHISELKVANGAAGTELGLAGNVDLSDGRRTLSINATLGQDLARISTIPERFKGRGKLAIEANVTSPDFAFYRVRAAVKGEEVSAVLSRAGIEVQRANGEVPILVEVAVGADGLRFARSDKRNPYSMLRFADQHPLLTRSGFLSIERLKTPFVSIAPLVGNLEVDQNVVSLRQFEMGVRGGSITGLCGLDWDGANSTLELHVRASGVKSSHGEPFDGNIAVAISAADRTIDGRAEIVRIGVRHLLDLLDLQDPLRVDSAMNRIRSALDFGYPKSLRLVFDHGFASAHLELGGLAKFVSIAELRGIPMGPIVDKMIARMLDSPARQVVGECESKRRSLGPRFPRCRRATACARDGQQAAESRSEATDLRRRSEAGDLRRQGRPYLLMRANGLY
jgi:translocation and assembly module TamB